MLCAIHDGAGYHHYEQDSLDVDSVIDKRKYVLYTQRDQKSWKGVLKGVQWHTHVPIVPNILVWPQEQNSNFDNSTVVPVDILSLHLEITENITVIQLN